MTSVDSIGFRRVSMGIELPIEMIQHIQSFLEGRKAAQTSVLSKSWYAAWLTRPDLELDEYMFFTEFPPSQNGFAKLANKIKAWLTRTNLDLCLPNEKAFVKFVTDTLQRYVESNLKIKSFKLWMTYTSNQVYDRINLPVEWTKKAMKLGATDVNIEYIDMDCNFVLLPREVLESETLVRLSLSGCRTNPQKISCSRLKYLNLRRVCIQGNNIWDIIWRCPLIEELVLDQCEFSYDYGDSRLALKSRSDVNDFHKLKVLSLRSVEIGELLFLLDSLSKFPRLKELTLYGCNGYEEIQICNNSLEFVHICHSNRWTTKLRFDFDVPRIRKFKYLGDCDFVPSMSFKTTPREWEWESDISFRGNVSSSWFVQLRKFLMELKSSKIYLSLWIAISPEEANQYADHMIGLPKPLIVEKLTFGINAPSSVQSTLVEDLFWSCRPKFISLSHYGYRPINCVYDAIKLICNTLTKEECSMNDLEEINVEIHGHTLWTWSRPLPTKIPDTSAYSGLDARDVCLHLKWG